LQIAASAGVDPLAGAPGSSAAASGDQAVWRQATFKRGSIPEIAPPPEFCV